MRDTFIWDARQRRKEEAEVKLWNDAGRPVPPPHRIKQQILEGYAANFGTRILIETGTFMGDMLYAMKSHFDRLISIELSPELANKAKTRFIKFSQIEILNGDSGKMLKSVLQDISQPTLFWLDGHYSSGVTARADLDTPIVAELQTIFSHPVDNHVILIDDARLFNGTDDYPTIPELQAMVQKLKPDYSLSVRNDVIRIHPQRENLSLTV